MAKTHSDETRKRMSIAAQNRCTSEWRKTKSAQYSTPIDIDKLRELYESGLTQVECASVLGTTQKVVWKAMKNNGIKARTAAKRDQYGIKNDYWKGGTTISKAGYVWVRMPNHPRASSCGNYVSVHVLVMERHLGRFLNWYGADDPRTEIVHHINGDKADNRIENLKLMSISEHTRFHSMQRAALNNGGALCQAS